MTCIQYCCMRDPLPNEILESPPVTELKAYPGRMPVDDIQTH